MDRQQLREKIDAILKAECKAQIGCPYNFDCKDHPDCFEKELDQILARIPDEKEIRDRLTELDKKLDDREVDLIEAKREERERIYRDIKAIYKSANDIRALETAINEFLIYEEQALKREGE